MANLRLAAVTMIGALLAYGSVRAPDDRSLHWYRCNTHTHTSAPPNSDANGSPELVVSWYKAHGYHCLVITDHEYLTDVEPLNRKYVDDGAFLVIRGQEVTQGVRDSSQPFGFLAAHVNGINIDRPIMPMGIPQNPDGTPLPDAYRKPMGVATMPEGTPLAETYLRNVAMIRDAGGIAQINHPNLHWSVMLDDLLPIDGILLFEVWNAFPSSNNLGGTDDSVDVRPSTEALWDALLSRGKTVWGVASDDTHEYVALDDREAPTPGKGWIVLQAPSLTLPNVMDALRRGRFYASTGVTIERYHVDRQGIAITLLPPTNWSRTQGNPQAGSAAERTGSFTRTTPVRRLATRYLTRFVGAHGHVLDEVPGLTPSYRFRGDEQYVRVSIVDSDGRRAWTQPVFPNGR